MGKRKKSSRKPVPTRRKVPLDTTFTCLFCNHDKSVSVRLDRKEGVAHLVCRVCGQRYQSKANHLTEPVDIYSEWIDAADAAQQEELSQQRIPVSGGKSAPSLPSISDEDDE